MLISKALNMSNFDLYLYVYWRIIEYVYVRMYVRMYVSMYVRMYVCMYVCTNQSKYVQYVRMHQSI